MSLSAFDIEIIEKIKSIILADLQVHHNIDYLAAKAGMSKSRLTECFKQVVKSSLYAYLKEQRMLLAATLLEQNDKTLQQVSKCTGFRYYSNFTRAFKKHFGTTPGIYMKKFEKKFN